MADFRDKSDTPRETMQEGSRATWERVMGANNLPLVKYDKTSVLILGWDKQHDDTETAQDLIPLQEVLRDTYRFPVQYEQMHLKVHPQVQATRHISQFVYDHDGSGGLLVVYYAGHGWAEDGSNGHISLSGRFPNRPAEKDMSIEWIEVERTLGKTTSDVLVIFDCCHAGLLCRPAVRGSRRSFHYVAACKEDQITRSGGEKSFTTALTWALRELANSPGFTVTRLVETLMEYKSFPRHEQQAVIYPSRFGKAEREIWISPARDLDAACPAQDVSTGAKQEEVMPTADVLDLRFHFAKPATATHIENTAMALKGLMESKDLLHFHRISFVDHTSFVGWTAKRWLARIRSKSSPKDETTPVEQHTTVVSSAAGFERFESLLLQLPGIKTVRSRASSAVSATAVATPASVPGPWEKDTFGAMPEVVKEGVLYHLSMALKLVIQEWRPLPAWH